MLTPAKGGSCRLLNKHLEQLWQHSMFSGSLVWCQILIWRNYQLWFKYFFCFFPLFLLLLHVYPLQLSHSPWNLTSVFSVIVLFAFQFLRILVIYSLAQILSSPVPNLLASPSAAVFYFCSTLFYLQHLFWVLSQDFHFSAYIFHLFLHAVYFIHQRPQHINHCSFQFPV